MTRISALALVLLLGFISGGCADSSSVDKKNFPPLGGTEVLKRVYDDQRSTVYIKADNPMQREEDAAIADIMTKKKTWEQQFPLKKVIAMSVVTGDGGGYGHPIVVGLLIHYESR